MTTLTINGKKYEVEAGQNVLQAALDNGITIPHLCYNENVSSYGGCRLCLVEITRRNRTFLTASCTFPVLEGIAVQTDTPEVKRAQRLVLELLLPLAPDAPAIQSLARELGVGIPRFTSQGDGCIRCGLCVRTCNELVGAGAITFAGRGSERVVEPPFAEESEECIGCGACVYICPTGCITMEEKKGERIIARWQRNLKLKSCTACGRPHIPLAQVSFARQRAADPPPADWFNLCPDCR